MPPRKVTKAELVDVEQTGSTDADAFSAKLQSELRRLASTGLNPTSALRLLTHLVIESASSDKTRIEKLKMMDKLLNTSRALMETGIKHEETAIILGRLEQLEERLEQLQKKSPVRYSVQ